MLEFLLRELSSTLIVVGMGFAIIIYLYHRQKFPRASRLLWGMLLILLATVTVLALKQFGVRIDVWIKVAPMQAIESNVVVVKRFVEALAFLLPFSFAAVGAGLLANALVVREEV